MPTHTYRTAIAAGVTVDNIMAGTPWVYTPRPALIKIYASQNGAGATTPVFMDVMFGNAVYADGLALKINSAAGVGPDKAEDLVVREVARAGDPIMIRLRNTAAGAATPSVLVDIDFIA